MGKYSISRDAGYIVVTKMNEESVEGFYFSERYAEENVAQEVYDLLVSAGQEVVFELEG